MNDNMNSCLRTVICLAFIVSNTYEMSVSTRNWNSEVLPVVYTPLSMYRLLSWQDENGNILTTDRCQGVGCKNGHKFTDILKYSFRADFSSGYLTIMKVTMEDIDIYQCLLAQL